MMTILLSDAGKRFNRDWIFRQLSYSFEKGQSYAIVGPNGSGKSTLLQAISGAMQLSEGTIQYYTATTHYTTDNIFRQVSICAPYLEVVEEMTLTEFLSFHQDFKPFVPGISIETIISEVGLTQAAGKQIRNFSSGMKQRVKLAQCLFSDSMIVLLDEPCTNLDSTGIELYRRLIRDHCQNRLVIVSSNDEVEYQFCRQKINIRDYS